MIKSIRKIVCIAVCLIIIAGTAIPSWGTVGDGSTTIKVGFFAFDGYHEQDENGRKSGYGYEIMEHLEGYTGFRFEYVGFDKSWSEMQDMLENGEIDILTSAQKTEERMKRFEFSDSSLGASSAILTVKAGDSRYMLSDYVNWNGIRVGMIEESSRNDRFAAFAAKQGFIYSPVYYSDTEKMMKELKSDNADKSIDAVLTSNLRQIENEWILAQFDSSSFYIMVKKGRTELLDHLNISLENMYKCEPGIRAMLMNKYYTPSSDDEISFTLEEREYIEEMQETTLTALINPDNAPYSYIENGRLTGILFDLSQEIINKCKIDIKFIPVRNRQEYWDKVIHDTYDIRFDAEYNYNLASMHNCWLTSEYITIPASRVFRKDTLDIQTAAIPLNSDIRYDAANKIKKEGHVVCYYNSVQETVDAVLEKERDAAYLTAEAASIAIRDDVTNRLMSEDLFGYDLNYAIEVRCNQDPLLFSILNKVVLSLDENDIDVIRQSYSTNIEKPFNLVEYFYDYPIQVMIGVISVLFVMSLIIILFFLVSRRKAQYINLQKEQEQNELLKNALASAEKADQAKSQFLSRVSHEMRTPLNAIMGFIELAKEADAKQMEDYLVSSDMAAKQLLDVINDVLDMSSIESGKMKIGSAPFNFKDLVSSITNIYNIQCIQKNLSYETKVMTPVDDWLIGDELRINQILMNLLGNAVKFTSEGHIWLTLRQTDIDESSVSVRFEITDTGCGMSDEMKERLFVPFEQESAETAKKYGGSGLGLSIVKNLVDMMDGAIAVESRIDEGTSFIVDLPFAKAQGDAEVVAAKKERGLGVKKNIWDFGGKRVMLVEDHQLNQIIAEGYLKRMNFVIDVAENGRIAVDKFLTSEPGYYDAILMDIQMPVMDGFEATKAIRASDHPEAKTIRIIAQTADAFSESIEKALSSGMNAHVSKPIKPEMLAKALSDVLTPE